MRYAIGDIHGMYAKMLKALENAGFDREKDTLYSVGDFSDRGSEGLPVIRYLMGLGERFKAVYGNHDYWLYQFLNAGARFIENSDEGGLSYIVNEEIKAVWDESLFSEDILNCWLNNGGGETIKSLSISTEEELGNIKNWLEKMPYSIETDKYILRHTYSRSFPGNDYSLTMKDLFERNLLRRDYDSKFWDRDMLSSSTAIRGEYRRSIPEERKKELTTKPLIIGHSPTLGFNLRPVPVYDNELNFILIDTGSFVDKRKYGIREDGEITIFNMDECTWVTSRGESGKFNL